MEIEYAQLINSFVSTEGQDGIMTNYIYYSVLVVFKNGTPVNRSVGFIQKAQILSLLQ